MTDPEVITSRRSGVLLRGAAVLTWIAGVGFGLPGVYAIWYFVRHDQVWMFLGNPTYGGEVFPTTVPLLILFLLVCVAEVVAGWMLWRNHPRAVTASSLLLPIEFVFWIGFVLPVGPLVGLARMALIVWAWRGAKRYGPCPGSVTRGRSG